jgi:NTP pyrophosphatase (non-canonical NTP hydrolase)
LGIEASELEEMFLRKSQEDSYEIWRNEDKVKEEFADVFIYLVLFAEACWIDIEKEVLAKLEKNGQKYSVDKAKGKSDKYDKL